MLSKVNKTHTLWVYCATLIRDLIERSWRDGAATVQTSKSHSKLRFSIPILQSTNVRRVTEGLVLELEEKNTSTEQEEFTVLVHDGCISRRLHRHGGVRWRTKRSQLYTSRDERTTRTPVKESP